MLQEKAASLQWMANGYAHGTMFFFCVWCHTPKFVCVLDSNFIEFNCFFSFGKKTIKIISGPNFLLFQPKLSSRPILSAQPNRRGSLPAHFVA